MLTLLLSAAAIYGLVVLGFYLVQRAMVFPAPRGYTSPEAVGLAGVREAPLARPDGARVMVWRQDAKPGRPTILHFHGNADNISHLGPFFELWGDAGWGAAVMSYRGYPGSTGKPSETTLVADGIAAFDALVADGVAPEEIVIAGYSIGTGVAVAVAAARPARALFLVGAFSSAADIAKSAYPFLPVHTLMRDPFRNIERIEGITMPVFLVHGSADRIVPLDLGERLFAAANEPKRMLVLPGEGHLLPPEAGVAEFRTFLEETTPAQR